MSVLSIVENDDLGLGPAEIAVTPPRAAADSSPARPAVASGRLASDGHSPAPTGQSPGERSPRVRQAPVRQGARQQVRLHEERGRAGGVRLTRRGRTVLACFVVTVLTAAVMLLWLTVPGGARAASHAQRPVSAYQGLTRVMVRPGQPLWSIASRAEPAADPRIVIQQIIEVNALSGTVIQPGETLWVPRA